MKYLIIALSISLAGCSSFTPTVTFSVKCNEMKGRVGNTCIIEVPNSSNVQIDGEAIKVDYEGRSL